MSLLKIEKLTVSRGGIRTLDVPEFHLDRGEVLGLIGPNGAGKSTLLLALARLIPVAGEFRSDGTPIGTGREIFAWRRRLAMVFQEPLLFDATVAGNIASGLRIRGMRRDEIRKRVSETLELFGITPLAERSARKLSGGEAQRTSLARAFALRPELILLDEPFTSLDPPTRGSLTDDLVRILRDTGTSAVIATHDQVEALRLSDRLAVLREGRIVQTGPASDVVRRPADEFVASFVGMENILCGTVAGVDENFFSILEEGGEAVVVSGTAAPGERITVCIHPEDVALTTDPPGRPAIPCNIFPGKVERVIPLGSITKVYLDCGFRLVATMSGQSLAELGLQPGSAAFASFKPTAVHLLRRG